MGVQNLLFADGQRIKCFLCLHQRDYRINGRVQMLKEREYDDEIVADDDVFVIDASESEWDCYGGMHIVLMNGYVMDGFLGGNDFMGVWKDSELQRFGHFQYEIIESGVKDELENVDGKEKDRLLSRVRSLDSDDDHEEFEEDDID